ncbi:hypothetical protein BT63DRAFT_328441 [Microthyrium microscopicum]|uniref:Uncharacterized protein n=1 Tax=Microthyrium microscopicum TaxID=703497 RepID=A0A6A6U6Z0_9PEZI|nr:hypothetical protein BT63DRAFT_328441 [Microthyrium microscopicum]
MSSPSYTPSLRAQMLVRCIEHIIDTTTMASWRPHSSLVTRSVVPYLNYLATTTSLWLGEQFDLNKPSKYSTGELLMWRDDLQAGILEPLLEIQSAGLGRRASKQWQSWDAQYEYDTQRAFILELFRNVGNNLRYAMYRNNGEAIFTKVQGQTMPFSPRGWALCQRVMLDQLLLEALPITSFFKDADVEYLPREEKSSQLYAKDFPEPQSYYSTSAVPTETVALVLWHQYTQKGLAIPITSELLKHVERDRLRLLNKSVPKDRPKAEPPATTEHQWPSIARTHAPFRWLMERFSSGFKIQGDQASNAEKIPGEVLGTDFNKLPKQSRGFSKQEDNKDIKPPQSSGSSQTDYSSYVDSDDSMGSSLLG